METKQLQTTEQRRAEVVAFITSHRRKPQLHFTDCIRSEMPGLREMRNHDAASTEARVMALLTWAVGQFNVSNNMTPEQMAYCAQEIVATVHGLNLDDIDLCFRMAVRGDYGVTYNRIDTPTVFEWIKKYRTLRYAEAEKISSAGDGQNLYDLFKHPQMAGALQEVVDAYAARKAAEPIPPVRKVSAWEKMLQDEWDALEWWVDLNGDKAPMLRWYGGKDIKKNLYCFTDYCAKRLAEVSEADPIN